MFFGWRGYSGGGRELFFGEVVLGFLAGGVVFWVGWCEVGEGSGFV